MARITYYTRISCVTAVPVIPARIFHVMTRDVTRDVTRDSLSSFSPGSTRRPIEGVQPSTEADSRSLVLQAGKMARALLLHVVCCCLAASTVDAKGGGGGRSGPAPIKCCDGSQIGSGWSSQLLDQRIRNDPNFCPSACSECLALYNRVLTIECRPECPTCSMDGMDDMQCTCVGPGDARINPYIDKSWMKCTDGAMAVPGDDCPFDFWDYIVVFLIMVICAPLVIWCRLCEPTLASAQCMLCSPSHTVSRVGCVTRQVAAMGGETSICQQ